MPVSFQLLVLRWSKLTIDRGNMVRRTAYGSVRWMALINYASGFAPYVGRIIDMAAREC